MTARRKPIRREVTRWADGQPWQWSDAKFNHVLAEATQIFAAVVALRPDDRRLVGQIVTAIQERRTADREKGRCAMTSQHVLDLLSFRWPALTRDQQATVYKVVEALHNANAASAWAPSQQKPVIDLGGDDRQGA